MSNHRNPRLSPNSLFARTALTLLITFGLFALLTFFTVLYYALIPVADRSTRDLAAFMLLSTHTLVQLGPQQRTGFRDSMDKDFGLRLLEDGAQPADLEPYYFPYVHRLELALEKRLGYAVDIRSNREHGKRWFWVRLPDGRGQRWVGFSRDRIHTRPLEGVFVIFAISAFLVFLSAALLARRVSAPLERLSRAAEDVAKGISPRPLPETGPRELANLAHQFNEMSRQVRELLANRTVLLAGISHDLRTPLTRLRLALEMLPPGASADLLARMERDMDEMNALIAEAQELGKAMGAGEPRAVDLSGLLADLCANRPRVMLSPTNPCPQRIDPLALRRIIGNLLENAVRYSDGPVELHLDCRHRPPVIFVLDRGPGIPEHEREAVFRPFYRLEQSRSRLTGGSGLGLAIARQLAIANGIEIRLGERRGGGTVVSVYLPAAGGSGAAKSGSQSS